jgi:aspartate aminotransferase-like enzyme
MMKYRLFAPGPTPVPESVQLAMAQPILHHRTPAFEEIFNRVRAGLAWIFQTQGEVLCIAGTGTAAMDGAVCNFLSPGDRAIFVNGGKFGERWGEILKAYGCDPIEVRVPWGQAVDPAAVEAVLKAHPDARAVYLQGCETSTGVMHPVAEVAALCRGRDGTLCVVDGITAVGVSDLGFDALGLDVLISGSQKAFMLPPGLAFAAVSPKGWAAAARATLPKFYLDFSAERQAAKKSQSAWTSAVSLVVGLDEALRLMRAEGLPAIFARHRRMAERCRAGLQALGCELYARAPADGVTAARPPAGVKADALVAALQRDFNLTIVGGQDEAKGKIFRVAHMGYFDDTDMLTLLGILDAAFRQLGGPGRP